MLTEWFSTVGDWNQEYGLNFQYQWKPVLMCLLESWNTVMYGNVFKIAVARILSKKIKTKVALMWMCDSVTVWHQCAITSLF